MCCAATIAKYVLFLVNLALSLLGIAVLGLGIATLVALSDLHDIIPVNAIPIAIIVVGSVVFFTAFLACCGAITETRWMLICYAVIVSLFAALKIWLAAVVFTTLGDLQGNVDRWIVNAFQNNPQPFHYVEVTFRCCGTTGAESYTNTNGSLVLPPSCCNNPDRTNLDWLLDPQWSVDPQWSGICDQTNAFQGCASRVESWFDAIGKGLGSVLVMIVGFEIVAVILVSFFCYHISRKNKRMDEPGCTDVIMDGQY